MFRKLFLVSLLFTVSTFAAAGSGVFIKGGVGKGRLFYDNDKYVPRISNPYVTSLFFESGIEGQSPAAPTNLALGYEFSFMRPLSVYGGVGYQVFGLDYNSESMTENWKIEATERYNYLTIPLGIKAQIPMRNGGFYATLNPQLAFLLSAKNEYNDTDNSGNTTTTTSESKENINTLNFLLGFKVGGDISIGKHNLFIEGGYDFGLTPLNSKEMTINDDKVNIKSGILTILAVGFRFNTTYKFRDQ